MFLLLTDTARALAEAKVYVNIVTTSRVISARLPEFSKTFSLLKN